MQQLTLFFILLVFLSSCKGKDKGKNFDSSSVIVVKTNEVITGNYIGNGPQWGGYEMMEGWTGNFMWSDEDWNKMKQRFDFMKPPFMRIMINAGWNYIVNGSYNTDNGNSQRLVKVLEYCQQNNITVMFGEWGHKYLNNDREQIDSVWVGWAADYLGWLVNEKGFSCIKYYNMVNEPNGDWSSTNESYSLWRDVTTLFYNSMVARNLHQKVKIAGPDIAIWDARSTSWITNTKNDMSFVDLYDIHTYPSQTFVRDADYSSMIKAYKDVVPEDKQIVMGELGFKYNDVDATLRTENEKRIAEDMYASEDCNMFVYDFFYGIDMADAIIQCMNVGFAGVILWSADDAMYNKGGDKELKRWGFWNILGEEVFEGVEGENIRPWFYTMSLLSRYFPKGTKIFNVEVPAKKGLRAVGGEKDGKYTIAIVNNGYTTYDTGLQWDGKQTFEGIKKYIYTKTHSPKDVNDFAIPTEENLTMDLQAGEKFQIAGQSFMLFTNME